MIKRLLTLLSLVELTLYFYCLPDVLDFAAFITRCIGIYDILVLRGYRKYSTTLFVDGLVKQLMFTLQPR